MCVVTVTGVPGSAVFVSDSADKAHWIEADRAFQRFALQATAIDVRTAHLNQPAEVASLRPQFAESIGRPTTGRGTLLPVRMAWLPTRVSVGKPSLYSQRRRRGDVA